MITTIPLAVDSTLPVVQQLDEQILECVEDESLSAHQRDKLLAWVHSHLLSAYVAVQLDAYLDATAKPAAKRPVAPCLSAVEMISQLLQGGVPLGPGGTFQCPPSGCARALTLSQKMPVWVRRRIVLAAQRTRFHEEAELKALWSAVEAHLITDATVEFELADLIHADVPSAEALDAVTLGCLEAMHGVRGLVWTPAGAVLQA